MRTAAVLLSVLAAAPAVASGLTARQNIERTLELAPGGRLVVDLVWGAIEIEPSDGRRVELVAVETIHARSEAEMAEVKAAVALAISSRDGEVEVRAEGPFRHESCCCDCDACSGRDCRHGTGFRDRDYEVHYDVKLRVPREVRLDVSTVIGGDVEIRGTRGDFEVRNVNGGIEMIDVAGSGRVGTVNGPVRVTFAEPPRNACAFGTINGQIDVSFPGDIAADLAFKTMNGEVWTDYAARPLPAGPAERDDDGERLVIRTDSWQTVRVGDGGTRFEFETLNGDIVIRNARARATRKPQ
jgi:hypothetical protein